MPENKNWSKDVFTKMVKEYGDKIAGISDRVEKELKEILEGEERIELFNDYSGKKKLNKSVAGGEVLEKSTLRPIFSYDLGLTSITEADDFDELDSIPDEIVNEDPADDILDLDEISKYEIEHIHKIAEPIYAVFKEKMGRNIFNFVSSFLANGPGLANFNIFDGMEEAFIDAFSISFIEHIGKIYNDDYRLRKSYSVIVSQLGKNKMTIHQNLLILAKNASKLVRKNDTTNINKEQLTLFKGVINVLSILFNKYYYPILSKEMKRTVKDGGLLVDRLNLFIKDMNKAIKERKDIEERTGWIAQAYLNHFADGKYKSISTLFFLISSAVSLDYIYKTNDMKEDVQTNINGKTNDFINAITFSNEEIVKLQNLDRNYFANINGDVFSLKLENTKYLNINYKKFTDFITKQTKDQQTQKFLADLHLYFKEKHIDLNNKNEKNRLEIFKILMNKIATYDDDFFARKKIAELINLSEGS